ncbi:hypothetical protein ACOMHN_019574 [Nucella lapillus]
MTTVFTTSTILISSLTNVQLETQVVIPDDQICHIRILFIPRTSKVSAAVAVQVDSQRGIVQGPTWFSTDGQVITLRAARLAPAMGDVHSEFSPLHVLR